MSSEVEWGNAVIAKAAPSYTFSEIANQEYDRFNKAEKVSSYVEGAIGAYDRRNDEIFKATGEKLFNPLRDIPSEQDLAEVQSAYRDMVGGGTVNKSRASFQEEWFASRYDQRLKDIATKYPHLASVVKADRSPILDHAEAAQRAEQKSAEMADRIGMVDVRESVPALKKVPILPDVANLTANIATNPTATVAQFWGGFKAQMQDPVEAAMNLAGFGAGRASMSVLKTAMLNAAANAAVEAVANPLRQYNRKEMGLDYGWERFFSDVSGAAATGALLDAGVRGPYRAVITRFGRDVPEGQMFSKQGRGGLLTDAIPQMDPIKPVVREKITPEEYEKARTGDIDAIESIAKKSGAYDDPAVKGMVDYAKLGGVIDDEMVKRFEAMGIDHGEKMATLKAAIEVGGMGYVRMPDPIPEATRALDTAGAAELAPRLAEIDQRLAEAPQSVRHAVRAGLEAGIPEIVDAARKAISGDLEGMRKAIDEAGGEQALTDRVIVHTATNPVTVAMALRRSPQVMDSNVSLRTDMMRMARALSALDEPAFRMVLEGKAHPMAGQLVADMVPPGRHVQVLNEVANFRSMEDAKAAIPDLIPEPSRAPEATGTRVSDPAGPEAKAQIEDLEKAHKAEVDRATEPARKREELESKVETLKGEIAKLEEQQGKTAPEIKIEREFVDPETGQSVPSGDIDAIANMAEYKRANMTPEERRARPPWMDYDVAAEQQIVRMAGDKMFSIADRGKASLDETVLSPPEQKLLAKLTERTGLKPDDIAEQRAQGQSFGKKIDAALDKATKFEGAEKAADELATKRQELRAAERELEQVQLDQARTLQDPALFNAVMRRAALQRQLDVRRAIDDALRLGDQMLPEGTRVEVRTDEMVDPTSGYRLDASSDMATGDIALASYAMNPAGRIGHEGVHTLVTNGHVAPEEVKLLANMARERGLFKSEWEIDGRRFDTKEAAIAHALKSGLTADDVVPRGEAAYRKAYADRDNLDALIDEEAAAHAIEARINGTDIGPANTMADRIKQLIERIRNALDGYGFKTADDVARAIINGEAAQRTASVEWMRNADITAASVKDGKVYAFGGERAKTADLDALSRAKSMADAGDDRTKIWTDTGWFRGVDGKWRFEISDDAARLDVALVDKIADGALDDAPASSVLKHNGLYSAYPVLGDLTTQVTPGTANGSFGSNVIEIGDLQSRRTMLHELQHGVQSEERFARGGSPYGFTPDQLAAERALLTALQRSRSVGSDWTMVDTSISVADMSDVDIGRSLYRRLAGEAEARTVEKRMNMTPDERRARAPWLDYDVEESQQIVRMFALADSDTGRSMRADLDALGYYSKALEAAKSMKQAKGTPEQMFAQLKAAGVKQAELDAVNIAAFIDGKKSVTRDDLVKHLTDNRVGVNEKQYGYKQDGWIVDPLQWGAQGETKRFASQAEAEAYAQSIGLTREHAEEMAAKGKWQNYSLDPSNPSYRETVLHLPENAMSWEAYSADMRKHGLEPNRGAYDRGHWRGRVAANNFHSGHFSEPNIIGHMMTSLNKHEGKPVFTLDQIQSDWGQKIRDEAGVRNLPLGSIDAQKSHVELLESRVAEAQREYDAALTASKNEGSVAKFLNSGRRDSAVEQAESHLRSMQDIARMARAELNTKMAAATGHPLVNTTDQWTITTLRRALRQAVEADAEFIAIPHGDTVLSYNPGDEGGMRGFYGSRTSEGIVPKNLRKLLEKIDKDAKPLKVESLDTPSGRRGWKQGGESDFDKSETGFTLFPLTDRVKRSVMEEGQAMFALSREPIDMSPDPLKSDMAVVDRMNSLRDLIEACR